MTWQNLSDLKQTAGLYAVYDVNGIPNYVLISPKGKIVKLNDLVLRGNGLKVRENSASPLSGRKKCLPGVMPSAFCNVYDVPC